ncbi:hypothetical protein C4E44_13500, partial [Pseudomonas sp. MWU12-2312b]
MPNNHDKPVGAAQHQQPKKAGDIEPFPSGKMTYLALLPLPTLVPPYGPHIGELNDVHMDFGVGSPQVFSWQLILGVTFSVSSSLVFLFPLITGLLGVIFGYEQEAIWDSVVVMFEVGFEHVIFIGPLILLIGLGVWHHNHKKRSTLIP